MKYKLVKSVLAIGLVTSLVGATIFSKKEQNEDVGVTLQVANIRSFVERHTNYIINIDSLNKTLSFEIDTRGGCDSIVYIFKDGLTPLAWISNPDSPCDADYIIDKHNGDSFSHVDPENLNFASDEYIEDYNLKFTTDNKGIITVTSLDGSEFEASASVVFNRMTSSYIYDLLGFERHYLKQINDIRNSNLDCEDYPHVKIIEDYNVAVWRGKVDDNVCPSDVEIIDEPTAFKECLNSDDERLSLEYEYALIVKETDNRMEETRMPENSVKGTYHR